MTSDPQQLEPQRPVDVLDYGPKEEGFGVLLRRTFSSRRFLIAFGLLLAAAAGLNVTVRALKLNFRKLPVPMRMRFDEALPGKIVLGGGWVQIAREEILDERMLHALGTTPDKFLFCNYVRLKDPQEQEKLLAKVSTLKVSEQEDELLRLRREKNDSIGVGLTYYTGQVDTVAHIPERCYLGGGYEEVGNRRQAFVVKDPQSGQQRTIEARLVKFRNPATGLMRHVAYFFKVNGQYEEDATVVRAILADLRARRAYYAKVELSYDASPEAAQGGDADAVRTMRDFIEQALPRLEKAWPEWDR